MATQHNGTVFFSWSLFMLKASTSNFSLLVLFKLISFTITVFVIDTATYSSSVAADSDVNADELHECMLANGALHRESTALTKASNDMWEQFEQDCESTSQCIMQIGNETAITHIHYVAMRDSEAYADVRKACHDLGTESEPTSLCRVDSILDVPHHGNNNGNSERLVKFVSHREPVCYHYDCGNNQIALVDPRPLGCNQETHDCIVHSLTAECPERPPGAGLGNCRTSQAGLLEDEAYLSAKNRLNSEVTAHCRGDDVVDTESDALVDVCTSEISPIPIFVSENFRHSETNPIYEDYTQVCDESGGQTCFISLNSRIVGKVLLFNLDVTADYNDFPICLPSTCSRDIKEAMAQDLVGLHLSNRITEALQHFVRRRRHLQSQSPDGGVDLDDEIKRLLADSNRDDVKCPYGMSECTVMVSDFYCTGIESEDDTAANSPYGDINIKEDEGSIEVDILEKGDVSIKPNKKIMEIVLLFIFLFGIGLFVTVDRHERRMHTIF